MRRGGRGWLVARGWLRWWLLWVSGGGERKRLLGGGESAEF
jgi:hypothetical protein